MKYFAVKAIDFTQEPPATHGIALMNGHTYDESTKIQYLKSDTFFRVANVDGSLYMYLSEHEVSPYVIREEIKDLDVTPL